jgi:hypothetical protein
MALTPSAETPTTKATSGDAAANATTGQGGDAVTGEQVGHEQQAVAVSRSRTMDEHDRGITNLAQVHDPAVVELVVPWSALVAAGHRLDRTCGREYRHRCEDSGYSRCSEMTAARSHTHTRNVAPFHGQVIRASPESCESAMSGPAAAGQNGRDASASLVLVPQRHLDVTGTARGRRCP